MKKDLLAYSQRALPLVILAMTLSCREKEPRLTVYMPSPSSHFAEGDTIHFASELNSDLDPGVIKEKDWRWVSDGDGEIGRGPRVNTPKLGIGKHEVTAIAIHRLGVSQASVTVFVDPRKNSKTPVSPTTP